MAYIVTAVGAGGKTSYLKRRAREYLKQGKRVAVTTTTHIWPGQADISSNDALAYIDIKKTRATVHLACREKSGDSCGSPEGTIDYYGVPEPSGKLSAPDEELRERICREYDVVLVEGDGSHCMPAKIPGVHEPVIWPDTDEIVVIMGAHAVGRRIDVVCHRYEGRSRERMTEQMLLRIAEEYYLTPIRKQYPGAKVRYELSRMPRSGDTLKGVLMASGFGRRYGGNKLLDSFQGKPLYLHALEHVTEALGRENTVLVTQYDEIAEQVRAMGIDVVRNELAAEGISASIRLGTRYALERGSDAVMFFAADMPKLPSDEIALFARQFLDSGKPYACMEFGREHVCTNPGAFRLETGAEKLLQLDGDRGAMQIMKQEPWNIYYYQIAPEWAEDVDVRSGCERREQAAEDS